MRRLAWAFLGLLTLFPALPTTEAEGAPAVSVPPIALEKYKLPNGLEVILHEDNRTPIVTVNLWYHVGSKDEPAHRNGFAHLFEHLMFQGSKHLPEDTWFRYLERVGATNINGSTSDDRTNYHETVPSNRLELALWMESDRMGFLLDHVDEKTFESQREVVKNERRQNYENAPYGLVWQHIQGALFPEGHPYHFLTIGTPEDLDHATLEDVKSFFRTWYVPNNATLVLVGDFDKAKAKALIERYFGPIPGAPNPARQPAPAVTLPGTVNIELNAGVELPRLYLAWPTPAYFAHGDGDLDLVAHVLAAGKTSRLYKRLVYDMKIATDVSAGQASNQLASKFIITATARPGHTTDELLAAIDDEIERLKSGGITDDELARARTMTLSGMLFGLESGGARADLINLYNQDTGDPGYLPKDLSRYRDATATQVEAAAKDYLPKARRVVAAVSPLKGAPLAGELVRISTTPAPGGPRSTP